MHYSLFTDQLMNNNVRTVLIGTQYVKRNWMHSGFNVQLMSHSGSKQNYEILDSSATYFQITKLLRFHQKLDRGLPKHCPNLFEPPLHCASWTSVVWHSAIFFESLGRDSCPYLPPFATSLVALPAPEIFLFLWCYFLNNEIQKIINFVFVSFILKKTKRKNGLLIGLEESVIGLANDSRVCSPLYTIREQDE